MSTQTEIDKILSLQFIVAWAGELAQDPERLGWWQSDLVDALGGGEFFRRLVPATYKWAALQAAHQVARLVDDAARLQLPDPDQVRTLFFWGFETNEKLDARILQLKLQGLSPEVALNMPLALDSEWDRQAFSKFLESLPQNADYTSKREGRELKNPVSDCLAANVEQFAKALLPLDKTYPLPYFRVKQA